MPQDASRDTVRDTRGLSGSCSLQPSCNILYNQVLVILEKNGKEILIIHFLSVLWV